MSDKYAPTKDDPSNSEAALVAARAIISAIPSIGGPINEVITAVLVPSIEKRRQKWMDVVAHGFTKLEEKFDSISIHSLAENEKFISVLLQASHAALKTHEREKLLSLRNSIINVAVGDIPLDAERDLFINIVDQHTIFHLLVLKYLHSPGEMLGRWERPEPKLGLKVLASLESAIPNLDSIVAKNILANLYQDGLISIDNGNVEMSDSLDHFLSHAYKVMYLLLKKRTTRIGDKFIAFIESPIP